MVKFLINRPIAVIMTFLAILFIGAVSVCRLPVSLMPDIEIPEITVQAAYQGIPAREMENTVITPIRMQLMQVAHLQEIESETRNGYGVVRLKFTHGTDINYAYLECNEKIDDAMNRLPRGFDRPRVIKASATDIPVFNLMINGKEGWEDQKKIMELSELVQCVILKRIEQLPQVAMVDINGTVEPELVISPDPEKLKTIGISDQEILNALESNNCSIGNLMVRDGYYQYQIRFANNLGDADDIGNIYIGNNDRLQQLKNLAKIEVLPQERRGTFMNRGKTGLCLAIIKQSDARMVDLKNEIDKLILTYQTEFPLLDFEIEKDQTSILTYSLGNLRQSLWFGGLLAMVLMFLFLKDLRSPLLIAFSIPVSLVVCLLMFSLSGMSMNIISLSGLVLAVGMMVDNSIIVIDNINQYIDRDFSVEEACVQGTNEVIRPLISSGLTTCAVFVPLIFLSGISGALFYDQAISVTIGLLASFLVSITLIPTLFRLFYLRKTKSASNIFLGRINRIDYERVYDKLFDHVFKYRTIYLLVSILIAAASFPLFKMVGFSQLPKIKQTELVANLDWNEPVHIEENARRVKQLVHSIPDSLVQYSASIGEQQFVLDREAVKTSSESEIYIKLTNGDSLDLLAVHVRKFLTANFPYATVSFHPPENIFEAIFSENMPELITRLSGLKGEQQPLLTYVTALEDSLGERDSLYFEQIPMEDQLVIEVNPERLLLYGIDIASLKGQLEKALNQKQIGVLHTSQSFMPIVLADESRPVADMIRNCFVRNKEGMEYPLTNLVQIGHEQQYKTIKASRNGEYVPLVAKASSLSIPVIIEKIRNNVRNSRVFQTEFDGAWFHRKVLIRELALVLMISVLLLYFILAAQFESFLQPLILLVELPIDIASALFMLWIFGETLNLMSAIGIIVMSGIIINDSILKVDTINRTRRDGHNVLDAIHIAGRRRLKPILMTSLTTILGFLPIMFFNGLGTDLQKPLALTIMGGMTIGTLVSIFIVPIIYWAAYRKDDQRILK